MKTVLEMDALLDMPPARPAVAPPPTPNVAERVEREPSLLGDLIDLTKPRMNLLVLLTTLVGYYLVTPSWSGGIWLRLAHTLLGTALTAAGASILNQYIELEHDRHMPRTANRPLPAGRISPASAQLLGVLSASIGVLYLAAMVNTLTATLGVLTFSSYVFVYTPLKRKTTACTIVGAVPGAIPPLMGWAAAANELPLAAWTLFAILFMWQLPHFLAIAILYKDDYAAGGFKMLPVVDPTLNATGRQIVIWSLALIPVSLLPSLLRVTGPIYFAAAAVLGIGFAAAGLRCAITRQRVDARRLFFASIFYLPALVAVMVVDKA